MHASALILSLSAGMLMAGLGASAAKSLPDGYCGIVYASEPTLDAVQDWIANNPSHPPAAVFRTNNDFLAVTGGIIPIDGWEERVQSLQKAGMIPDGAFCSARGLVQAVSPFDFLQPVSPPPAVTSPDESHDNGPGQVDPGALSENSAAPSFSVSETSSSENEIDRAMAGCDNDFLDCAAIRQHQVADRERRRPILDMIETRGKALSSVCDDSTTILDLCWKLAPDEMEAILTMAGFTCETFMNGDGVECAKGEDSNYVNLNSDEIRFDCVSLDVCGLSAQQATDAAVSAGLVDKMVLEKTVQLDGMAGETIVQTYCGEAEDGQRVCVEVSSRGDVRYSLLKGAMGRGRITF